MVFVKLHKNGKKIKKFKYKLSNISETMKINILIITWINRILMLPFAISLIAGTISLDFFFYAALIAFFIGCFQVFSFLSTCFYFRRIENRLKRLLLVYISMVVLYFVSSYLLLEVYDLFDSKEVLKIIFWIIPVILSIFWTFILESIKQKT